MGRPPTESSDWSQKSVWLQGLEACWEATLRQEPEREPGSPLPGHGVHGRARVQLRVMVCVVPAARAA